jgi:hypothetical protein
MFSNLYFMHSIDYSEIYSIDSWFAKYGQILVFLKKKIVQDFKFLPSFHVQKFPKNIQNVHFFLFCSKPQKTQNKIQILYLLCYWAQRKRPINS